LFCSLTLLASVCLVIFSTLGQKLQSQQAAKRFTGDSGERFAQASAFFPVGKGTDEAGIYGFRETMEEKLSEASIEAPENGSLWADCYSAQGEVNVTGPRGSSNASVIGVGGDYFLFHPCACSRVAILHMKT
jgi:hypothetical protein